MADPSNLHHASDVTPEAIYQSGIRDQEVLLYWFSEMTFKEWLSFVDYFRERTNDAVSRDDLIELLRVRGLYLAVARKLRHQGNFMDNLSIQERMVAINLAESTFACAEVFYPDEQKDALNEAWKQGQLICDTYGYLSGPVYEVMAPHHVFADCGGDPEKSFAP